MTKFFFADENLYRWFFFFTGEYFLATNWHEDFNPKFESKLFWNYFSCRSKVPGNLTAKSDYEFTVKGIQIIQKITNKKVAYGLKRLLKYSSETFLISTFLLLRYYNYFNYFQKEFLEISSFLRSLVKSFAKSKFLIKNELFYINQIYWLFWKYRNTPLITL